ncbi:LysR family transcriptional regulator [Lentzea sp. NPDC059081]|uniref:LysR family transcriptional regulator n=1 Tax=Lentzea sp. NPDC059081 TaxID=3346719 RepID=UPI0036BB1057
MELRHLRTFRAVARTLNLTKAAAELHYAQSSVTEQIQTLEAELGTLLFDRTRRKLSLTPAGERLVGYADQVLVLVEEAKAAVEDDLVEPSGPLVIGALETLCSHRVPELFADYRGRWPKVRISLKEGGRGELYSAVQRGEMDVCFTFGDAPDDPELTSETLATDQLMIITPPGHPLAALTEVRVRDLDGVGFLATPPGCGFRAMLDQSLLNAGPQGPVIDAEVGSLAALCRCVTSGVGCGLVPEIAARDHAARGDVAAIPLQGSNSRTTVTMTWLRRQENKPSVAALLATARGVFASRAAVTRS